MKIYIGSDHAGFELKGKLMAFLLGEGHEVEDKGAFKYDEGDDYPDFVGPVAKEVSEEPDRVKGIVIGASGQGEAFTANRFKGVRAVVYYGPAHKSQTDMVGKELNMIESTRSHNDANVLSLGARFLSDDEAKQVVKLWLATPFSGDERHVRRIEKIDNI